VHYGSSTVSRMRINATPTGAERGSRLSPAVPAGEFPLPELDGVRHRFVDLPGLRMHVAEAGHGEPLLLLHGFPEHWWQWRGVLPLLAQHYRVLCPDLRGAGWTDAPAGGYDREQLLADVVALLDAEGVERVPVVAHDWAALLGFALSFEHPERVERFVSVSTPHPYIRFHWRLLTIAWRLWFQFVIAAPGLGPLFLRGGNQRLARHLLRAYSAVPTAFGPEDVELFLAPLRSPARARAASSLYRRLILPEAGRIMSGRYRRYRLRPSTLVLLGAEDPTTQAPFLSGFEGHADDLTIEYVPGASHFVPDEKPAEVAERVLRFLQNPGTGKPED
jgi:pimeloyl-ACP methyl ester carboxylesterase